MTWLLLLARLLLAGVFLLAGLAKFADLAGSRRALREFGVPERLAAVCGTLLPAAELLVAVALLPVRSVWWGAIGALTLLLLFIAGMLVALARGRQPDCHCFGQLHTAKVGPRALLRNTLLALPAVFILIAGSQHAGADVLGWTGRAAMPSWIVVAPSLLALVVGGVALWLLLQLVGQNGRLLTRLETLEQRLAQSNGLPADPPAAEPQGAGLPLGSVAPAFQLPGLHGETLTLDALRASGTPVLLSFMDPGCGPCTALLPDLGRWQRELAGSVTLALVSRGSADENRVKVQEQGLTQVLLQTDREVATAYEALGTPSMVLVRPDGSIGSALAQGAEQIRALVARTMGQPIPSAPALALAPPSPVIPVIAAPTAQAAAQPGQPCPQCGKVHDAAPAAPGGLSLGQPAPALTLPDLDGRMVELAGPRAGETVVLLWNPGCGFCQQLLPELLAWEQNRPADAPALLVVSTGERATNASLGLTSQLLLQTGFEAGSALGLNGTPSALLLDRAGNVASVAAVGGPAVLALLGARASQTA